MSKSATLAALVATRHSTTNPVQTTSDSPVNPAARMSNLSPCRPNCSRDQCQRLFSPLPGGEG